MLRDIALRGANGVDDVLHNHLGRREHAQDLDAQGMRHSLHGDGCLFDIFRTADQGKNIGRRLINGHPLRHAGQGLLCRYFGDDSANGLSGWCFVGH